ncbi:MAG: YraN family protein [Polyangia bacterium]
MTDGCPSREQPSSARAAVGARAEGLAAALLEASGYRIVERNWRRPEGELDLVAYDQGVLVFVEVRSRAGEERGHPLETVNARKRARVVRAARLYLECAQPAATEFRFDVVGVTFARDGAAPAIIHVQDAFRVA